ncbi:LysE family translocator [bacterium]|nr:LysE family translocator [bacterium]
MSTLLPDTAELLAFISAGLLLNIIPGQDMLYVIVQSSAGELRRGLLSALAIGCGSLFHVAAVCLGLAGLLQAVPLAYELVRLCGALYLIWLGITMWRNASQDQHPAANGQAGSMGAMFLSGMLTNMLNPKVALFFLALLPQFCDPARGRIGLQLGVLGLIFSFNGTLVLLIVALATVQSSRRLAGGQRSRIWLKRIGGTVLGLLGLRLLLQRAA